jgi:hypothetical protein
MLKDDGWEQVSGPRVTRPTERQGLPTWGGHLVV